MADQALQAHEQNMAQIAQCGVALQGHIVTSQKIFDLDYAEGKRIVGMVEAMGVREVAAKTTPGGPNSIPYSG